MAAIVQGDVVVIVATGLKQNQVDALEGVANGFKSMKIPAANVNQFRTEFLAGRPIPQILDPTWNPGAHPPGTPIDKINKYGVMEHFLRVLRECFFKIRNQGKNNIAEAAQSHDDGDIVVS